MMDVATLTLSLSKKNVRSTLYCALQSNMFNKQNLDSDATLRKRGSGRFFQAVHTTLFKRFSTHASPDAEEHITEDIKPSDYSAEKKELYQNTSGKIAHRGSYSPLDFVSIAGSESAGSIYGEAWPVLEVRITAILVRRQVALIPSQSLLLQTWATDVSTNLTLPIPEK